MQISDIDCNKFHSWKFIKEIIYLRYGEASNIFSNNNIESFDKKPNFLDQDLFEEGIEKIEQIKKWNSRKQF